MMNLMCFVIPVTVAVLSAKDGKAGFAGFALVVAFGLILGTGCAFAMWAVGERVIAAVKLYPELRQERYFRALCLGAVVWLLLVAFLAMSVTSAAMRFAL
jgi:hypothetical protein